MEDKKKQDQDDIKDGGLEFYCNAEGCENPVNEEGHLCSTCYIQESTIIMEETTKNLQEGRETLANLKEEIQTAENRLAEISQSADEAMSNQARASQPATFRCRFARVGSCR